MDDAARIQLLQAIMPAAAQAAQAKAARPGVVDAGTAAAVGGGGMPATPQPPVPGAMSQADFSGYGMTPEQKALRQQLLIRKLRETGRL